MDSVYWKCKAINSQALLILINNNESIFKWFANISNLLNIKLFSLKSKLSKNILFF